MSAQPISFLIVEDDDVDYEAIIRCLRVVNLKNVTRHARDGAEAIDMLRGENGQEKIAEPVLVFLDLNLPKMGGHDVLEQMRDDPGLSGVDVVVVTTSRAENDIKRASQTFPIQGYLVKDDLVEYMKEFLADYNSPTVLVKDF